MKSKELAEKYLSASYEESNKVLNEIINGMFQELLDLRTKRNLKFDIGLIPIVKETDAKFRKFASIVNSDNNRSHNIKQSGFLEILKTLWLPLYELYINSLKTN